MNYITSIVPANRLVADDRFKMGGSMYRIADTSPNLYNEQIIWFHLLETSSFTMQMVVPQDLKFKIYNQKIKLK